MKKNEEYIVDIVDNGFQGEGIAKIDGMAVFVPGTIKGEKVKIKILKVTSSHSFGKIIEILEKELYLPIKYRNISIILNLMDLLKAEKRIIGQN